jgi:hypothetical protein
VPEDNGWGMKLTTHLHLPRFKIVLIIKPTRCTNFSNLFLEWNSTCFGQFLCPSSGVCHIGYADCLLAGSGWNILISLAVSQHNLYDIYLLLCIQYKTPDNGQKTCPKHVELYSKNKFEKLVHLIGFIIRIYHNAQSSECQICLRLCGAMPPLPLCGAHRNNITSSL